MCIQRSDSMQETSVCTYKGESKNPNTWHHTATQRRFFCGKVLVVSLPSSVAEKPFWELIRETSQMLLNHAPHCRLSCFKEMSKVPFPLYPAQAGVQQHFLQGVHCCTSAKHFLCVSSKADSHISPGTTRTTRTNTGTLHTEHGRRCSASFRPCWKFKVGLWI